MQKSQAQSDKSWALKDAYVDEVKTASRQGRLIPGIAQQPAVIQASVHAFPESGKMGAINDGDPNFYVHGENGESYMLDQKPRYANPVPQGESDRILMDGTEEDINNTQYYLDRERGKMGGTGNLVRS